MKEGSGRAGHATERVRLDGSRFQPECKVHVYDAWAWEEDAPADRPDWLGDTMVSVDVTKKGISRVQAYLDG